MLLTFASLALLGALSASAATAAADETTPTGQAGGAAHWVVWAGPEPHSSMQGLQSIRVVFDNFTDENDGTSQRCGLDVRAIRTVVEQAAERSGLLVQPPDARADADLEVLVGLAGATAEGTCTGLFHLMLTTTATSSLPYNASVAPVKVFLLAGEGVSSGPSTSFAQTLGTQIRNVADAMLVQGPREARDGAQSSARRAPDGDR